MESTEDLEDWLTTRQKKGILRIKTKGSDHTTDRPTGRYIKRPDETNQITHKPPTGQVTIHGRGREPVNRREKTGQSSKSKMSDLPGGSPVKGGDIIGTLGSKDRLDGKERPDLEKEEIEEMPYLEKEETSWNNKGGKDAADDIQTSSISPDVDAVYDVTDDVTYDDILLETENTDHRTARKATQTSMYENLEGDLENVLQETLSDVETQTPPIPSASGGYENLSTFTGGSKSDKPQLNEENVYDTVKKSTTNCCCVLGICKEPVYDDPAFEQTDKYTNESNMDTLPNNYTNLGENTGFRGKDADGYTLLDDNPNDHVYEEIGEPDSEREHDQER